jgi:hypothetical protein
MPMGRLSSWVAVGVLVVMAPTAGNAVVFCEKKSGAVIVRDACKAREQQMDLSAFGAVGAPGAPGATGPGVFVVDANGATVGALVDEINVFLAPISSRVVRQLGSDAVSLPVDPAAGFPDTLAPPPVFFANAGCTGQMFVVPPPYPPGTAIALAPATIIHGSTAYYAVGLGATQAYASILVFFISPATCTGGGGTPVGADGCCVASASSTTLSPARSFDLGTLGLVAPFHAVAP